MTGLYQFKAGDVISLMSEKSFALHIFSAMVSLVLFTKD